MLSVRPPLLITTPLEELSKSEPLLRVSILPLFCQDTTHHPQLDERLEGSVPKAEYAEEIHELESKLAELQVRLQVRILS
ncbi:MAG: hypothetical protein V3U49_03595 [Nitrososphaerales archaeon]